MINNEKFKVGLPAETYLVLKRDAEQFEIMKDNGREISVNGFLSLLIVNYYRMYKQEKSDKAARIREIIGPWINTSRKKEELVDRIMEETILPKVLKRKGKKPERMSITPTRETDRIITEIRENNASCSEYLCRMFMSYCEKPLHERERIIFRENVDFLEEACRGRREITFTTKNNPRLVHQVVAYDLAVGADEMNNYLLGQEYKEYSGRIEPVSYRLCRICRPDYSDAPGSLDDEVVRYLELSKKSNPQYVIAEDSDICVKLTPAGQRSYRQIYFARPAVDREHIELLDDGCALYHFDASQDMVFRFVIRFRAGEAEVIYPPELRERVCRHFRESLAPYEAE